MIQDYRVAIYGAGGVGKSSIVNRFIRNQFNSAYVPTIEDTYQQVITSNQKICMLQIIDTTGSHQFPAMQRLSIAKAHAFILVYSVTTKHSLEELVQIIHTVREVKREALADCPTMLVGNKIDDGTNSEVPRETGANLAKTLKFGFIETSAKTNTNITELFQQLLALEKKRKLELNTPDVDAKTVPSRRTCTIL